MHGQVDWGGQMLRINGIDGVNSLIDVLKTVDQTKIIDQEIKLLGQKKKVEAERKKAEAKQGESAAGGPRDGSGIEGMDSNESSAPTEQPGVDLLTEASPLPTLGVTKSWFIDNFGMQGNEICELLIKSGREDVVPMISPIIKQERIALLESFPSVSSELVERLPFTDFDYAMLQKNEKTLEIPFRRFVKAWNDSDEEGKSAAYQKWSDRISKQTRLSAREHNLLSKCSSVLVKSGSMNAQALQSYGLDSSTTELSMLIKSHGFLYGIQAVNQDSNSNVLFYDVERGDLLVKNTGALIGGLFDNGGSIEIGPRGTPRIILPFNSSINKHYASALCEEIGVSGIHAEGDGLVIEGESSVSKSLDLAMPFIHHAKESAIILRKAISNDNNALRCLSYDLATPMQKVSLLKKWGYSDDNLVELRGGLINGE